MNIDELIRESIDESTAGRVPSPDLDAIRRGGRRRSAVRTGAAALATVGVVAAGTVAVQSLGGPGPGELPASIRDQGAAITYLSQPAQVHIGRETFTAAHPNPEEGLGRSAATTAGLVYIGGDGVPYLLGRDGTETALSGTTNPDGQPDWGGNIASDAERRYVAWRSNEDGAFVVNLFDARSAQVTDSERIDCGSLGAGDAGCDYLEYVADGIAYIGASSHGGVGFTVAWDPSLPPGQQVYRVTDPGTLLKGIGGRTVAVSGEGPVYDRFGEPLDEDWTVLRRRTWGEPSITSNLTTDGAWRFEYAGREETPSENTLRAVNVHTGEHIDLLPGVSAYRLDDDGSVLVLQGDAYDQDGQRVSDCSLPSGTCTTAIENLRGKRPSFPGYDPG